MAYYITGLDTATSNTKLEADYLTLDSNVSFKCYHGDLYYCPTHRSTVGANVMTRQKSTDSISDQFKHFGIFLNHLQGIFSETSKDSKKKTIQVLTYFATLLACFNF